MQANLLADDYDKLRNHATGKHSSKSIRNNHALCYGLQPLLLGWRLAANGDVLAKQGPPMPSIKFQGPTLSVTLCGYRTSLLHRGAHLADDA